MSNKIHREKRDERVAKKAARKAIEKSMYFQEDENFLSFSKQLRRLNLRLRDIPGDGNCLFRALGDQLDGHCDNHLHHREETVKYMEDHRSDFEPFVEDDVPFIRHINNLRQPGTYAGNDAIVAFARNHGVNVVIHQLNAPLWTIKGSETPNTKQLHISYHNGDHYSSVRKIQDNSYKPANIKLNGKSPGSSENQEYRKPKEIPKDKREYVNYVSNITGCKDLKFVWETLQGNDYDDAIQIIMQIVECDGSTSETNSSDNSLSPKAFSSKQSNNRQQIWDEHGSGTRIFGSNIDNVGGVRPKHQTKPPPKLSNKKRKEQLRRDRKKRSDNNKRNNNTNKEDYDEITSNLSMLHI